jgi:hypothetical protein
MQCNTQAAYVNKPHVRAALFVHDRGEKVNAEHARKIASIRAHGKNY